MKRFLFVSVTFLIVLTACQKTIQYIKTPGTLEIVVEDDGKFPEFLVGKWVGDKYGWGFIFKPDGTILRARIAMGQTEITPGKVTTVPTVTGGKAIYVPGHWTVSYLPADRELIVDVVMNYIRIDVGDQVFRGRTRDIITGTVSKDGNLWRTVVSSFPEYEGFPNDPNDLPYTTEVIFTKSEEEEI
jgi:hypothetical protein